ncbi:hypothetical protein CCYA_CCYA20G4796 [Cyanidiococcus yangmingshanensis]|nr:hypothetical protein CCYA_CCYA20G4796 [Cyanidiococcus yangmingshanensis]
MFVFLVSQYKSLRIGAPKTRELRARKGYRTSSAGCSFCPATAVSFCKKRTALSPPTERDVYGGSSSRHLRATLLDTARVVTLFYAVIMAVGGVGAYLRTKSKASVVSGLTAAVLLGVAYSQSSTALALGVAVALTVVFGIRYSKSKKLMPSGILGGVSAVVAIFLAIALSGV